MHSLFHPTLDGFPGHGAAGKDTFALLFHLRVHGLFQVGRQSSPFQLQISPLLILLTQFFVCLASVVLFSLHYKLHGRIICLLTFKFPNWSSVRLNVSCTFEAISRRLMSFIVESSWLISVPRSGIRVGQKEDKKADQQCFDFQLDGPNQSHYLSLFSNDRPQDLKGLIKVMKAMQASAASEICNPTFSLQIFLVAL